MGEHSAEIDATREAVLALTWFPAIVDTVSGRVSPPRRKTHVRVRDIDAALAGIGSPRRWRCSMTAVCPACRAHMTVQLGVTL